MANKVTVLIDVVTDRANSALGKFRTEVGNAEGAVGKFKAGAGAAFENVKQNAGNLALAAGTALVAFGVQAVSAFQDTALAAGKLRDSLGLTAEEASRYIEVAGDVGIETTALESTIGRMNRAATDTPRAFDAIGAAIGRNRDGTTNVNQTFLNVVDALNKMPDASERAAAAQKIFGRSWMDIAELVGMGAEDLQKALDGIETNKIIDDEEIAEARRYRDAMDALKGVSEDLTLAVGSHLVPVIADLAEGLQIVAEKGRDLGGIIPSQITKPVGMLADQVQRSLMPWKYYTDFFGEAAETTGRLGDLTGALTDDLEENEVATEEAAAAAEEAARSHDRVSQALDTARRRTEAMTDATLASIDSSLGLRNAQSSASDAFNEYATKAADATTETADLSDAQRDAEGAALSQAAAAVKLAEDQAAANGATLTAQEKAAIYRGELESLAAYASGPLLEVLQGYIDMLGRIPADVATNVRLNVGSTRGVVNARSVEAAVPRASGGIVGVGETTLVGEQGPELVQLPAGSRVNTASQTANMLGGGGTTNIYMTVNGGDPNTIIAAIKQYERRNGPGWRQ